MKRLILALILVAALTGCAPKMVPIAPVVAPQAETTAQVAYTVAARHASLLWQTYAWSGHKWSSKSNLLQHNEWGKSIKVSGAVLDSTNAVPASFMKVHKVIGIVLYVPGAGGSWKWPSVAYVKSLHANRIKVGWVWEAGASAIMGGRPAGVRAAKTFLAMNKSYGVPAGSPCYFACDFDAPGNSSAIHAFLDGAASVLGIGRVGLYAGLGPITYNLPRGASYDFDVNVAKTADWGQERGGDTPAPKPMPKPVGYHTRAVMRRTSQLWNGTIGTKRRPSPVRGGVVSVLGHLRRVRGLQYIDIGWGRWSGSVRYDDIRWLP